MQLRHHPGKITLLTITATTTTTTTTTTNTHYYYCYYFYYHYNNNIETRNRLPVRLLQNRQRWERRIAFSQCLGTLRGRNHQKGEQRWGGGVHTLYSFKDMEDATTDTDERAIASPAYCGGISMRVQGYRTPNQDIVYKYTHTYIERYR